MKMMVHKNADRGHFDHGWLKTYHSFSFAGWHDPSRVHFGMLRVLNDDIIKPGMGFGFHPHDNMEIVTIPLEGALEHRDSMGHIEVITPGEVQVMSAGKGITHSEYNHSKTTDVHLLQIWVFPSVNDVEPRYEQKKFDAGARQDTFQLVVAPRDKNGPLWLHQDAFFSIGNFKKSSDTIYELKSINSGAYVFIIQGSAEIKGGILDSRDAAGIWDTDQFRIRIRKDSEILVIEVPMN